MPINFEELLKALIGEAFARRNLIFVIFVIISLSFLTVGVFWPKKYTTTSVIQIDSSNILQPLMHGAAETTRPNDNEANAREIIYGEKIMDLVLKQGGWMDDNPDKVKQEQIKKEIKDHLSIYNLGNDLIKIEYINSDPMKSYLAVKTMSEAYVKAGERAKREESQAAFDFIDKQVNEYLEKLTKVEEQLNIFRSNNPDARPGLETEVANRITTLKANLEQTRLDVREAIIKRDSIKKQLSGEAAITISQSREGQYRGKIAELQSQIETLRLDYKDTYPDIVRLKTQIKELKVALNNEIDRRKKVIEQSKESGKTYIDESILLNPLYQQLRSDLSTTETKIATLRARASELNKMLQSEFERAKRINGGEAQLSQLTRDYQVNQEIYQDLLRRRENARVSRSLDLEQKGFTFKIQEPAKLHVLPSGVRYIHFALAGLTLGILLPLGLIYLVLQVDPRVYFSKIIREDMNIPVLAEVYRYTSLKEERGIRINIILISIGFFAILAIYTYVSWLKFMGQL